MNTVDKELYEIEYESMLMDTALTALAGQAKILNSIKDKKTAKMLLPVLENNLGIEMPKERYAFSGILSGESMEVPSGEVLRTVKKAASEIYKGIKSVAKKLVELAKRFVLWVKSFFSKEAAMQLKLEKAFSKELDVLDKQLNTVSELELGKVGTPLLELERNVEKFIKDTNETNDKLKEVQKAFDDLPKNVTPEQAKKALESLEVAVDKDDIILDPKKLNETPVSQLVDESKVILTKSSKKADPKKKEINQPESFTTLQKTYFNPNASKPFDESNVHNADDIFSVLEDGLISIHENLNNVYENMRDDKKLGLAFDNVSSISEKLMRKINVKDLSGIVIFKPVLAVEKIKGFTFKRLTTNRVDRSDTFWAMGSKRPAFPLDDITVDYATETIEEIKSSSDSLGKAVDNTGIELEELTKTLDNVPDSFDELTDKEQKESSKESFQLERDMLVLLLKSKKELLEHQLGGLKRAKESSKALMDAMEDVRNLIRKSKRSLKK